MPTTAVVPIRRVAWKPCYRIVPTRFPPIDLFERIAPPEDWDALIELESRTNERLRDQLGLISLVASEDRVVGPGAGYVMAAFTHFTPEGGRFTDGTYGAYYCAHDLETAVAETMFHRSRFLAQTKESPMHLDMRVLVADLDGRLHDLRGRVRSFRAVYDPDGYGASQALARRLREAGTDGIVWDSVRRADGECAAAVRPRLLARCREQRTLTYVWNGETIVDVYEKRPYRRRA